MKYFDYYKDGEYVASGTVHELKATLGIALNAVRNYTSERYINSPGQRNKAYYVADKFQVYALYMNDELAAMGTMEEIAEETGRSLNSLEWYSRPVAQRRSNGNTAVIKLEDEFVIQRRTGVKYARKPVDMEQEATTVPAVRIKSAKPATWKPNPYTRMLFDHMFKRWEVEG